MRAIEIFLLLQVLGTSGAVPNWCNMLTRWRHQFTECQENGCNPPCSNGKICLTEETECGTPPCPPKFVCKSYICDLAKNVGYCSGIKKSLTRYFYNKESRKCEQFTYTGCFGNDNNFVTIESCQELCEGAANSDINSIAKPDSCSPACGPDQICLEFKTTCAVAPCNNEFRCVQKPMSCDLICGEDEKCEFVDVQCAMAPCNPVPECVKVEPVCQPACQANEQCVFTPVQCVQAPCPQITECKQGCNPPCGTGLKCVEQQVQCFKAPCLPQWTCVADYPCPLVSLPKDPSDRPSCQYQITKAEDGCNVFELVCKGYCPAVPLKSDCSLDESQVLCVSDANCDGEQKCCPGNSCGAKVCSQPHTEGTCSPSCGPDEQCVKEKRMCSMKGPCAPKWSCKKVSCNPPCPIGYTCSEQKVVCAKAPCNPVFQCIPEPSQICKLAADAGPCEAYMPMWHFNSHAQQCQKFNYGGCEGNANRFATQTACQKVCGGKSPVSGQCPSLADTGIDCRVAFVMNECNSDQDCANKTGTICCPASICGGNMCQAPKKQNVCQEPKMVGPCRASMLSWYFNSDSGQCETFYYGGCYGNDNRFPNKTTCEASCMKNHKCPMYKLAPPPENCYYHESIGPNGCPSYSLKCNEPKVCPMPRIQPKPGCYLDDKTLKTDGCPTYDMICPHCPVAKLAAPPDGCHYDMEKRNELGCRTYELVCEGFCPPYKMPAIIPDCTKLENSVTCSSQWDCVKDAKRCCPSGPCGEMSCQNPERYDRCDPSCASDETCVEEQVMCVTEPCEPIYSCQKNPSAECDPPCRTGQQCVREDVTCFTAPCNPVWSCHPASTTPCAVPMMVPPPDGCIYDEKLGEDGCPVIYMRCFQDKCAPVQLHPATIDCTRVDVRDECRTDLDCPGHKNTCCHAQCGSRVCYGPLDDACGGCASDESCIEVQVQCVMQPCPKQHICKKKCNDFACDNGQLCLPQSLICDGKTHCNDGSDENYCPVDSCYPACSPDESCEKEPVQCFKEPCPMQYVCKPKRTLVGDSCDPHCSPGQTCVTEKVTCVREPCEENHVCKADPCDGSCSPDHFCKRRILCYDGVDENGKMFGSCDPVFECTERGCGSCGAGEHCVQEQSECFPDGHCNPSWRCTKCPRQCNENEECVSTEVNCFRPPCIPIYECKPKRCQNCRPDERCVSVPNCLESTNCAPGWKCEKLSNMRCPSFDSFTVNLYNDCNRLAPPPMTCQNDRDCDVDGSEKVKCCTVNPCGGQVCKAPVILEEDGPLSYCNPVCGPKERCVQRAADCPQCDGPLCAPCPSYYVCEQATCDPDCGPGQFCIKDYVNGEISYSCQTGNDAAVCPSLDNEPDLDCKLVRVGYFCESDADCTSLSRSKCCKATKCGGTVCRKPIVPGGDNKPGRCPAKTGEINICVVDCHTDSDCAGNSKCCRDNCGNKCKIPIAE